MAEEKSVSLSELKEILASQQKMFTEQTASLIAEMKKPTVLEQQTLDKQAAEILAKNQERKDNAAGMKAKRDADRMTKRTCNHTHPNGSTHCVYVQPTRQAIAIARIIPVDLILTRIPAGETLMLGRVKLAGSS